MNPPLIHHSPYCGAAGPRVQGVSLGRETPRPQDLPAPRSGTVGRVEEGRGGQEFGSVSLPRSSNRTCGFPSSDFPTSFIARHTGSAKMHIAEANNAQPIEYSVDQKAPGRTV